MARFSQLILALLFLLGSFYSRVQAETIASLDAAMTFPAEYHGFYQGHEFWFRIHAARDDFGGNHKVEILYTQLQSEHIDNVRLIDHPFLLIRRDGAIVAWNERQDNTTIALYEKGGYSLTREFIVDENKANDYVRREGSILGDTHITWHLLPYLLEIENVGSLDTCYLFKKHSDVKVFTWDNQKIEFDGQTYLISRNNSQLVIADSNGTEVLRAERISKK